MLAHCPPRSNAPPARLDPPSYKLGDLRYAPSHDSSINAVQDLMQQQSVLTATANESAFVKGVHVSSHVAQNGQNKIIA